MIEPFQLVWFFSIFLMLLTLLVLIEVSRSNKRRENEVMFDTDVFDEKVKERGFSVKKSIRWKSSSAPPSSTTRMRS